MSKSPHAVISAAHAVRLRNLLALVGEGRRFPEQQDLANALDVTGSYISQLVSKQRRLSEVSARKFEHKLGLASLSLDKA